MNARITLAIIAMAIASVFLTSCCTTTDPVGGGDDPDTTVVFFGASITEAFYYPNDGEFFPDNDFHKVIVGGNPDKSEGFPEVGSHNPDVVTFKECAAYFDEGGGTDHDFLHQCMQAIADYCVSIGATPVPATTLPIDVGCGSHTQAQLDDIIEFNAWVRTWAANNGWECMDYYTWIADGDGQLPAAYHDGDGLHPNLAGYQVLGPNVLTTLGNVSSD